MRLGIGVGLGAPARTGAGGPPPDVAPSVNASPVMAALIAGESLSHTPGSYTGFPAPSVAVTYRVDGVVRPASFVVSAGESVEVEELASNVAGSVTATSAPVTVSAPAVAPTVTTPPVMAALTAGDTLSHTPGTYTGSPTPNLVVTYRVEGTARPASYVVAEGESVTVEEVATNSAGSVSALSAPVTVAAVPATVSYASAIAVGDSITSGGAGGVASFMDQVASSWGASLDNNGASGTILQNGNTADGGPRSGNLMDNFAARTITPTAEAVVCAYGFNDARYIGTDGAGNGYPDTLSPSLFKAALQSCCRRWLHRFGRDNVWLVTPHYISDDGLTQGSAGFAGQSRAGFEAYVTACREVAEEFGMRLVDTYAAAEPATRVDALHPDGPAAERIADLFAAPIQQTLAGGSALPGVGPNQVTLTAGGEAALIAADGSTETPLSVGQNTVSAGTYVLVHRAGPSQRWEIDTAFVVPAAVPAAVTDLSAVSAVEAALLSWRAPADGGAAIGDYVVEQSSDGGATWAVVTDGVSGVPGATATSLTSGQTYRFRVAAVNAVGQGPWSAPAEVTPNGTSSATIATLVDAAGSDGFFAPTDSAAVLWQDTAGTQAAGDGDPVARIARSAGTVDLLQTVTARRPIWDQTAGLLEFSRSAEAHVRAALPSRGSDMYLAFVLQLPPSEGDTMLIGSVPTGAYLYPVQDTWGITTIFSGVGSPSLRIDGQPFAGTTRDDLHTAIATDTKHVIEIVGADLSGAAWSTLAFGYYIAQFANNGLWGDFVALPTPDAADQDIIRTELALRHGIVV